MFTLEWIRYREQDCAPHDTIFEEELFTTKERAFARTAEICNNDDECLIWSLTLVGPDGDELMSRKKCTGTKACPELAPMLVGYDDDDDDIVNNFHGLEDD